jgi:putative transposase
MVKKCLSRMSWKLSRTVLRRGKGSNPFSLVDFTSNRHIEILSDNEIKISMDGKGRCMDNIFTERLWRSIKYQEVYINDYETPKQARQGIRQYLEKYNTYRPHQSLKNLTPAEVYFGNYTPEDFKA